MGKRAARLCFRPSVQAADLKQNLMASANSEPTSEIVPAPFKQIKDRRRRDFVGSYLGSDRQLALLFG
jgi:hypothetical protein